MANVRRLVELSMVPPLAKEVAAQIDAAAGGVSVSWAEVTDKPATFDPTIGTTSTTAMAGNTAIPAASAVIGSPLAAAGAVGVSTAFARADHVHAIPGASVGAVRGTVLIQAAEADLAGGADLPTTVAKVNALLAKLRTAGVLAT
jgi:hypothetical protein